MVLLRSPRALLQSAPRTLDSLSSALTGKGPTALAIYLLGGRGQPVPGPKRSSLVNLCLPPCLGEDRGCARLRAEELGEEGHSPGWLG